MSIERRVGHHASAVVATLLAETRVGIVSGMDAIGRHEFGTRLLFEARGHAQWQRVLGSNVHVAPTTCVSVFAYTQVRARRITDANK